MTLCGGFSDGKAPDAEFLEFFNTVRDEVLTKLLALPEFSELGESSSQPLEVVSYRSQVVAGTNFNLTLKLGETTCGCKIFRPLPHTGNPPQVTEVSAAPIA